MPAIEVFRTATVLTGPTGSGKSALALQFAERIGAEIIAMDSMTLYRGLDIGTAKPSPEERRCVPHRLIDVLDPWESASVAWWLDRAAECVAEIQGRGRRVLFVGGTPLYLKALVQGLFDGPPADQSLRSRLESDAERDGSAALHGRLDTVDPATAARLHPNDLRRIIRALEVWELTGRPISEWQQQWTVPADSNGPEVYCIDRLRPDLYERIDRRVSKMLAAGWLDEARCLKKLSPPVSREVAAAIGYRELFDFLEGKSNWDVVVEAIRQRTRNYAKRQLTWFRHLPACRFVPPQLTSLPVQSRME